MEYTQITYSVDGPIALITLNRPDRLNAWTPRMADEQAHAVQAANADDTVGAIAMIRAATPPTVWAVCLLVLIGSIYCVGQSPSSPRSMVQQSVSASR